MTNSPTAWKDASPSFQVVLTALRAATTDEELSVPTDGVDWKRVRTIATRHGVGPLVYEGLSSADSDLPVVENLRSEVQNNAGRNFHLANELLGLLDAFDRAGVRAIPYKGPVLATTGYGAIHRRRFLDIDVLVPPMEVPEAGHVLESNGYVPDERFRTLGQLGHEVPLLCDIIESTFHHPEKGIEVDLRWRVGLWGLPLDVRIDDLWNRRTSTEIAGEDVPALALEDRITVLAYHGTRHAWRRLAWLVDFAAVLRSHPEIDWPTVVRRARSWSSEIPLHTAVVLATTLFTNFESVPDRLRERAHADVKAVSLARWTVERLQADPIGAPSVIEENLYNFVAMDSLRQIPPFVVRKALQPRRDDYLTVPLPRLLWPTYVPLRAWRTSKLFARELSTLIAEVTDR